MKITFQISASLLKDGNYHPKIELEEDSSFKEFTAYTINKEEVYPTKEEALARAEAHAFDEARKQYGPDTEINIKIVD